MVLEGCYMKQINKFKSLIFGATPIYLANDGKSIDQIVVRYKSFFFMIDIDAESGEPTGNFGWSEGEPITPTPIKEFYTATREDIK